MKSRKTVCLLILLVLLLVPLLAFAKLSRVEQPTLRVHAVGPAGLIKIDMVSSDLGVAEQDAKVVFTSDMNQLRDKDFDLRTKHMREEFETSKFSTITLTVDRSDSSFPRESQSVTADSPGALTLHGVTQAVRIHYTGTRTGDTYKVSGSTTIDYTQFLGRKIGKFGVSVQPPVTIQADFTLSDQ